MSLKIFHIIFISLSILLSFGFGVWSIRFSATENHGGYFWAGLISFVVSMALIVYGVNFIKKMKGVS